MENTLEQLQDKLQLVYNQINLNSTAKWGQMNAQNMVEHLSLLFEMSMGKFGNDFKGDVEKAAKWKANFFASECPFPKGVLMPGTKRDQTPPPLRFENMEAAKVDLKNAVQTYLEHFEANLVDTVHPYFGLLSFEEWTHFHEKHVYHHLMQFGVLPELWTSEMEQLVTQISDRLEIVYADLNAENEAKWGMMNAHECIEHLGFVFLYATGRFNIPFRGDLEKATSYWPAFKTEANPWKTVFPRINFTKEPPKLRTNSIEEAKAVLKKSFKRYVQYAKANPSAINPHGFLGNISTKQWLLVHFKHLAHHLEQFGAIPAQV